MLVAVLVACGGAPADPDHVEGRTVYRTCAACHGADGSGGTGPSLADVLATFPDCEEHVRWIALGSERWRDEVGATYGTAGAPVEGDMPSFEASITERQRRQVAYYERVRFGGADPDLAREACGLG